MSTLAATLPVVVARGRTRPPLLDVAVRLARHPSALTGLVVLAVLVAAAVAAPLVAPYDPLEHNMADFLAAPGPTHWFGTDQFGRDIFSRVVWGGRLTLQ